MLYETIAQYCKLQRIDYAKAGDTFFLSKKKKRVASIKVGQETVEVEAGGYKERVTREKFICTLQKDTEQVKMLKSFKNSSKPKKWKKGPHRNKMTERGKEYMFEYTMRQNGGHTYGDTALKSSVHTRYSF